MSHPDTGRIEGQAQRNARQLVFLARRVAAAILAAQLLLTTLAGLPQFRVAWLAMAVTAAALTVLLVGILRPQLSLTVAILCGVLGVIQLANLNLATTLLTVAIVNPWLRLSQWMFALGPVFRVARIGLLSVTVGAIVALGVSAFTNPDPLHTFYLGAVCAITGGASSMALAICCWVVVRSGAADDELRQARLRVSAVYARRQTHRQSAHAILHYLHNTVVNTLHAIALGAGRSNPHELRTRCAGDLSALPVGETSVPGETQQTSADDVSAWARMLGRKLGIGLACESDGGPIAIPAVTYAALLTALEEALVNASKHAPGATASLRVRTNPQGVWIELRDDGPGFDSGAQPGYGLRHSIFANCRSHGIEVSVHSAPGRTAPDATGADETGAGGGAVVELLWSAAGSTPQPVDSATFPPLLSGFHEAYRRAAPWLLILCLIGPLMATSPKELLAGGLGWLLVGVCVLLTLAVTGRRIGRPRLVAVACLLLAAASAGLYTLSAYPDAATNAASYTVGLVGLVSVAAITLHPQWVVVTWLAYLAAIVAISDPLSTLTISGLLAISNVIPFAAVVAVLVSYSRRGERMLADVRELSAELIRTASEAGRDAAIEQRWEVISPEVAELLSRIADGEVDPAAASTVEQARRLESYTRALLAIPVDSPDAQRLLTAAINQVAGAGAAVEVRIVDVDESEIPEPVFARMHQKLDELCQTSRSVAISLYVSQSHGVLVCVGTDSTARSSSVTW